MGRSVGEVQVAAQTALARDRCLYQPRRCGRRCRHSLSDIPDSECQELHVGACAKRLCDRLSGVSVRRGAAAAACDGSRLQQRCTKKRYQKAVPKSCQKTQFRARSAAFLQGFRATRGWVWGARSGKQVGFSDAKRGQQEDADDA